MAEPEEDTIIEERDELMVSPPGGADAADPILRPAHFLKPSVSSIKARVFELPSSALCSETTEIINLSDLPLKVSFKGVRNPMRKWKQWVDRMLSLHQSTWEKAGICEAIISSTYKIRIDKEIVLGFASKWSSETNSFVFSWGEATITLEDVMVLGGFSVLGDSVLSPLETEELMEIDEKLMKGRREIARTKAHKPDQSEWMRLFMDSGSEIEHEAFLVLWLSRHVFPKAFNTVSKHVHQIGIHLARGTRVALAPAVLSRLYCDLSLLKDAIVASTNSRKASEDGVLLLDLWAPFQLVQIWAYERFPIFSPKPNFHEPGLPRMARWDNVKKSNIDLVIDSAGECFLWRPYAFSEKSRPMHKFYKEREEWVSVDSSMDEAFESYARFLRAGELVGLDCVEQYLPHRVAMQFGMDQDVPGHVSRFNETPEIAWNYYTRPIKDAKLYVPSRLFESDVTCRYLEWWKPLKFTRNDADNEGIKIPRSSRRLSLSLKVKKVGNDAFILPCSRSKRTRTKAPKSVGKVERLSLSLKVKKGNDAFILPCSHPKRKRTKAAKSVGKVMQTPVGSAGDIMTGHEKSLLCTKTRTLLSLTAENGADKEKQRENTEEDVAAMGGSPQSIENARESGAGIPVDNGVSIDSNKGEISIYHASEIPELEARICKLEEVVAQLKAQKLGLRKP